MPAKRGADNKQGLIIALVCFVLLSVILGVFTWFGYSDQANLVANEKKAKDEKSAMEKDREYYKAQALVYRSYMGYPPQGKEKDDVPVLYDKFDSLSGEGKEEVAKVKALLDGTLGWDKAKKQPQNTYAQQVATLTTELNTARAKLDRADRDLKKAKDDYDTQLATKDAEVQDWRKKFQDAQAAHVKAQQDLAAAYERRIAEVDKVSQVLGETQRKGEDTATATAKQIKRLEAEKQEYRAQAEKLRKQMAPPDLQKFSTPKAKIVRVGPRGEMAWVDIGSADNVRPEQGLTFSIFGQGAPGRAGNERKGALEIVDVLGPHYAAGKITEVVDSSRNPIMVGDVLVNPNWTPGQSEHVAIAGIIDLTGDGRDSTAEFINSLKRQGTVIDAYLDLSDMTVKGDGMNPDTSYLIMGEIPDIGGTFRFEAGAEVDRKQKIIGAMSEMKAEADRLGVPAVPLKRFVALTGYKLPPAGARGARIGAPAPRPEATEKAPSRKASDKAAPKEKEKDKDEDM
jgi:hypothetical protein